MRPRVLAAVAAIVVATAALVVAKPVQAQQRQVIITDDGRRIVVKRTPSRITVRPRSFLDAGTEVSPGERKYNDYAVQPFYSPLQILGPGQDFRRHPLPDPLDLPGFWRQ